jgi:hypothetical protein
MYKLIIHLHPTHIIIHLIFISELSTPPPTSGPHLLRIQWVERMRYGGIFLLVLIAWVALPTHHCLVMLLLLPLRLFCPFSFMCVRTFYFAEDQIRMRHVHVSNLRGARTPHDFVCQRTLSNLRAAPPKIRHQIDKIKHSRYLISY